jgi:hypothetical protein
MEDEVGGVWNTHGQDGKYYRLLIGKHWELGTDGIRQKYSLGCIYLLQDRNQQQSFMNMSMNLWSLYKDGVFCPILLVDCLSLKKDSTGTFAPVS